MIKDERFLEHMPATYAEILAGIGTRRLNTVRKRVAILHEQGKCHVSGWKQAKNGFDVPIYSAGPGEDVPAPRTRHTSSICPHVIASPLSLPKHKATWLDALIYLNGWPA